MPKIPKLCLSCTSAPKVRGVCEACYRKLARKVKNGTLWNQLEQLGMCLPVRCQVQMIDGLKVCPRCKEAKPVSEFPRRGKCKECCRDLQKEYLGSRRDDYKNWSLLRKYKLSLIEFKALLDEQGGACAACEQPFSDTDLPCVDHSHETGKVRGLLHRRCNTMLGCANDSPAMLRCAATYLERHASKGRNLKISAGVS